MKKLFAILLCLVFVASVACAAPVKDNQKDPVRNLVNTAGVFIGKVVNVATAGTGGEPTSLVVKDEKGQTMVFPLDQGVLLTSATANLATLGELKKNQKVEVQFEPVAGQIGKTKSVKVVE
jgi:predicted regulator of Ras-like GTPase activity (Roadblock/LC7/MglB family)